MSNRWRAVWLWISWVALAVLIYYPAAGLRPFFDDGLHVERAAGLVPILGESGSFFRPLQRALITWDWHWSGLDFVGSKIVALALLLARTALVYTLARRAMTRASALGPAIVSWIFLAHPILVSTVGKIDNNTEALGATAALAIVFILSGPARETFQLTFAGLIVGLGMLTKESFAGVALATPILAGMARRPFDWRRARLAVGVLTAVLGVYLALRWSAGVGLEAAPAGSRYVIHAGFNVLKNTAAGLGAILYPGNTMDIFVRLNPSRVLWSTLLIAAVALERLRHRLDSSSAMPSLWVTAAIAGAFPAVLISGLPSEHHLAISMPFVWLLIACPIFDAPRISRRHLALAAALITSMSINAWAKTSAERRVSDRAYEIGNALVAAFEHAPTPEVRLCVVTDPGAKYSLFAIPDHTLAERQIFRLHVQYPDVPMAPPVEITDLADPQLSSWCTLVARDGVVTNR